MAEFVVNNKVHLTVKTSLFIANINRELRIRVHIKRKEKVERVMKFAERIKKVQKETRKVLRKVQEEIKQQVDKERKKVEEWKKNDNVMLSTKDLVFKERLVKK